MTEYRRLPGKRRGFFDVSSVWAGPDHLLLVRGSRFREEYKRFYYRDVQAIAVARTPRFHISTRTAAIAAAGLLVVAMAQEIAHFLPAEDAFLVKSFGRGGAGILGLILLVWTYVSAAQSCRCRIYTAVSGDELPSIYRIWTARKFLAKLEPLIALTQGTIQGEWAAAAEARTVGPAPNPASSLAPAQLAPALPRRTLASDLFLVSLFTDALARVTPAPAPLGSWLPVAMELATVAGAVAVLVQYNRGRLRAGMHRVAIASLLAFGTLYYVQSMSAGITASMTAAKTGKRTTALAFPQSSLAQQVGAGFDAILIMVGLIISLRQEEDR